MTRNKTENEFSPKSIIFDDECLNSLHAGAEKVYRAVSATMGAAGRTVILGDNVTQVFPKVTKDGVTVAKEIELSDKYEKVGADILRQAAFAQLYEAGDGTTLTTILGYEIFNGGLQAIRSGVSRADLISGLDFAISKTIEYIRSVSKVATEADVLSIATIASNGDTKIAKLIAEAIKKVGEYGIIFYDKGRKEDHYVEYSEGYQLSRGVEYQEFNNAPNTTQLFNPYVVVTDFNFQFGHDIKEAIKLVPAVNGVYDRPLVIFCPEVKDEALNILALMCKKHKEDKKMPFCVWICPDGGMGTIKQRQVLSDIAAISGATYIKDEMGTPPHKWQKEYLGCLDYLDSIKIKTVMKGGGIHHQELINCWTLLKKQKMTEKRKYTKRA